MRKVSTYKMAFTLLAATSLLAGCSGDDDFNGNGNVNGNNSNTITFNTNVSSFTSKATTYDSNDALKAEGSFTCTAYNATTTTTYIDPTTVEWVGGEVNKWKFANSMRHDWPGVSALDFFAYMPATKPSYISSVSYATARQPQFVCTGLPTTAAGQAELKEFVCAMAINKNQENSVPSGVSMQFKHPFAVLKFKLDPASGTGVTINWVRIEEDNNEGHGIKTGGTCTIDGTVSDWSSQAAKNVFTWSTLTGDTYIEAQADETPCLVIPKDYSATKMRISVNATWTSSMSTVTETKTATVQNVEKGGEKLMNWEPGYSYLFTLTLSGDALIVNSEKYTEQW